MATLISEIRQQVSALPAGRGLDWVTQVYPTQDAAMQEARSIVAKKWPAYLRRKITYVPKNTYDNNWMVLVYTGS